MIERYYLRKIDYREVMRQIEIGLYKPFPGHLLEALKDIVNEFNALEVKLELLKQDILKHTREMADRP